MFFFLVQRSAAGSYSNTFPGGAPCLPATATGFPPNRYSFPLTTALSHSSFGSGMGASLTQRPCICELTATEASRKKIRTRIDHDIDLSPHDEPRSREGTESKI